MKLNFNFEVTARCKLYDENDQYVKTEDIILPFDMETAGNFLFKFGPSVFKMGKYKVILKYDNNRVLIGMIMVYDYTYVCTNFKQVISDVHEGYIRLQMLDKISDIMEFDFKAGIDLQNTVEDEFD